MTTEVQDGVKVIKLRDSSDARDEKLSDMHTLAHIWMLLNGGHAQRDGTIFARRVL